MISHMYFLFSSHFNKDNNLLNDKYNNDMYKTPRERKFIM